MAMARRRRGMWVSPTTAALGATTAALATGRPSAAMWNKVIEYLKDVQPPPSEAQFPAQPKSQTSKSNYKARRRKRQNRIRKTTKKTVSKDLHQLKKAVQSLKHSEHASLGTMTYRKKTAGKILAAVNAQNSATYSANTYSAMETALAELLYYDPAAPATLVKASAATGTYQKDFLFKSIASKLTVRNNYQIDANVIIYLVQPRIDTSSSPSNAWTDGIANDAGNVIANTDYGTLPTDFDTFRDFWNTKRLCNKVLAPGQSVSVSHGVNNVIYDPSLTDSHSLTYQKTTKNFGFLIIVKGSVAHDTVADQQGIAAAGVDVVQENTYVVNYDAGVNLSYVHIDNSGLDAFSNAGVQSHQPVPDNISYSVA